MTHVTPGFFTPIRYSEGEPKNIKQYVCERIEDYFYLGGREAYVIPGLDKQGVQEVEPRNRDQNKIKQVVLGAMKVVSYATGIIPLLMLAAGVTPPIIFVAGVVPWGMLIAKLVFRVTHRFKMQTPLTRQSSRVATPSWGSEEGRRLIKKALRTLPSQALDARLTYRRQKEDSNESLEEYLVAALKKGTCYGESMNIIETLCTTPSKTISEEVLAQKMDLEKIVRYQIAGSLHALFQCQTSAVAYGVFVKPMLQVLEKIFPHSGKVGAVSERMKFADYTEADFIGRLGDFLLRDMQPTELRPGLSNHFAIQIELRTKKGSGHAVLLFFSQTNKQFYLYDPYYPSDGLFSTPNRRQFTKGAAAHLMRYKDLGWDSLKLSVCNTGE